jgi:hypothetical protein
MLQESFSPQESGSDFASVVHIPKRQTQWPKLDGDDPLTVLHAKFWGKSMAIEEQEWRSVQWGDPARARDQDQDEDDPMDEHLDEDDDIIPGCYPLDLGINVPKIWIRADYIRIYDFLEAHPLHHHSGRQLRSSRVNQALVSSRVSLFGRRLI